MSSSVSGPLTIHSPQEWLEMAKRSAVLSWNRPILAPTFSPDRPHLPQPIQHWTPSTAIAPGPLNPTVAAPARPNAAVQWTPLHGGASSPFMPVFISPFAMLGQPMNPSAAHDDTTQTQAQHPHNDLTDLVNLPNRQKRGRALEIEGRVKKLKSKDDLDSDHAVTLCRYPPERTLRVSGIQSNATKEELVFFFRGCPIDEIDYYPGEAGTCGYAIAVFLTAPLAQEAIQRLRKRNIFGMNTPTSLEKGGFNPRKKATIISTNENALPAHLIFPSHYHPSAETFPDLEAAIQEGMKAAQKSVAEKRRLYITQLPFGTNESVVKELLKNYDTENITIPYDHSSRQPGGYYAFVDFSSAEEAARAKEELHCYRFLGREISIMSEPNAPLLHEPASFTKVVAKKDVSSAPVTKALAKKDDASAPVIKPFAKEDGSASSTEADANEIGDSRVQIDNLAFETTENDIRQLLHRCSFTAISMQKYANTSCPTGSAFVDFCTADDAARAILEHRNNPFVLSAVTDVQSTTFAPDLPESVRHIPNSNPREQFYTLSLDVNARNFDRGALRDWWLRERGVKLDI